MVAARWRDRWRRAWRRDPWLLGLSALAVVAVLAAWVTIVVTGRYPRGLFRFVEGVFRWNNRVVGYALTLVSDAYPPFRLAA